MSKEFPVTGSGPTRESVGLWKGVHFPSRAPGLASDGARFRRGCAQAEIVIRIGESEGGVLRRA